MSAYKTVVVGTDGSDSSLRAVEKAGYIAGADARSIMTTAYFPQGEDQRASDVLKDEGYKMAGNAPIYAILREAKERAHQAGAKNVEEKAIVGAPVDALVELAEEVKADLLVVGNVGSLHDRGPPARIGARQRRSPVEDRRAHRAHDAVDLHGLPSQRNP